MYTRVQTLSSGPNFQPRNWHVITAKGHQRSSGHSVKIEIGGKFVSSSSRPQLWAHEIENSIQQGRFRTHAFPSPEEPSRAIELKITNKIVASCSRPSIGCGRLKSNHNRSATKTRLRTCIYEGIRNRIVPAIHRPHHLICRLAIISPHSTHSLFPLPHFWVGWRFGIVPRRQRSPAAP